MAFLDKLLSGRYPNLDSLWTKEFNRVADEVFASIDLTDESEAEPQLTEPVSVETMLQGELDRLTAVHEETVSRLESAMRQLDVVKAERNTLQTKLDALREALSRL